VDVQIPERGHVRERLVRFVGLSPILCSLALLAAVGGCSRLTTLRAENETLKGLARFEGTLSVEGWHGRPLWVVVMQRPDQTGMTLLIKARIPLNQPGPYSLTLEPGEYMVGAFEDDNNSGRYDFGERAGAYHDLAPIDARSGGVKKQLDVNINDEIPTILRKPLDVTVIQPSAFGRGSVVPLSDPRFAPENAELGVWQPATFQAKVGMGLFMLEPYDPARIPVVFVHGLGGHPREFETLIDCLDKQRFQSWVVQYASGWQLAPIAHGLNYILTELQRKYQFQRVFVVAHSMGGLVSRRMLQEHVQSNPTPFITKFVTLDSPLGGMPSAELGVHMSPSVVPSWRDLGPTSDYLKRLYEQPLPPTIEYILFFAFHDGEADDGVVDLTSQLRQDALNEATRVHFFENTHTGVLKDPLVCKALATELSR
jgi:pimeloyl-ACP methyl ester carboxylesterase